MQVSKNRLIFVISINKQTKLLIMETITIKRTWKNTWMIKFDDYEKSYSRISKKEAIQRILEAREKNTMICDGGDVNKLDSYELFCYKN